ncbi:GNAT family N-acetyltransferase [Novosphingobium tardum]|uniref:GNAT family N-acetyltransferase n=1 Tax=Novosphingobium tardum TaxID=1538021 RepID=A0ABV8RL89_9SPHN
MDTSGPLLVTERLELWRPRVGDHEGLHDLLQPEETRRFLGGMGADRADSFARLLRNAGSWQLYGYGSVIIRLRGKQPIVGICGVFHSWRGFGQGMDDVPEAGWIVGRDHWGQGIAGEAMHGILDWFDKSPHAGRVACMIEEGNAPSQALARTLGFVEYDRHYMEADAVLVLYERGKPDV